MPVTENMDSFWKKITVPPVGLARVVPNSASTAALFRMFSQQSWRGRSIDHAHSFLVCEQQNESLTATKDSVPTSRSIGHATGLSHLFFLRSQWVSTVEASFIERLLVGAATGRTGTKESVELLES